ncbi:flagellar biosynthesis protein FlhB [Methylomarinum vadi]|uniref:flagellar biosynthesis protein FlhB n=1 Tax=Methylomarinum vadi TaxID=438855 RepID=UPI0004DECC7D|nr:flagellar biosynthesis protein FlhB [Methylomarinum vadi]
MAEDSGQDKTEEPTAKRLADARKKGQVPRSRELDTFVSLMVGSVLFIFMGGYIAQGLAEIMRNQLSVSRDVIFDPASPVSHFNRVMVEGVWLIMPFALVLAVAALITPMLMGGWNFSGEALQPKLSKFNPLNGMKKIFGIQGVVELIKALIKVTLVFLVADILFNSYRGELMGLNNQPVDQAIYRSAEIILWCLLLLSSTLLLVVVVDVPYQLWNNKRQLKMTKQEVKDESKESEGSPEVKGRIRRMQMDIAQRRMMEEVPKADVIVTNPSHYAVALKYDRFSSGAPRVVAKGVDLIAAQIRNAALAADVPLVAAPPLARALYYSTDLNEEIPQGLFLAVAQVLAYVFQLQAAVENGWAKPYPPADVSVPDDFRQY